MDLLKLGLRNILGISLPGAILLFSIFYILWGLVYVFDFNSINNWIQAFIDSQVIAFAALFVVSYMFGSLIRLGSADDLDKKSGEYFEDKFYKDLEDKNGLTKDQAIYIRKNRKKNGLLYKFKEEMLNDNLIIEELDNTKTVEKFVNSYGVEKNDISANKFVELFDHWIWTVEKFPYPVWELRKFMLYLKDDVYAFYKNNYGRCMGIGEKSTRGYGPGRGGKEFFNFCKMAIFDYGKQESNTIVDEVNYAEAMTRLYAGSFTALQITQIVLIIFSPLYFVVYVLLSFCSEYEFFDENNPLLINFDAGVLFIFAFISVGIFLLSWFSTRHLVKNFRTLRLKEADTVYDAFYIIHNDLDVTDDEDVVFSQSPYKKRSDLLCKAFSISKAEKGLSSVSLGVLGKLMRERSKDNNFLSSIYFAGAEEDHPFFLKSNKVAIGIAVLPEDSKKSGKRKLHQHQQEVIVVLEGTIVLKTDEKELELEEGQLYEIKANTCHQISSKNNKESVFLFLKNNPSKEPRGTDC